MMQKRKQVGMRMIVLENRANASRPGMLQSRPDDIKMLTLVASRKAMLSENSDADRASMPNVNSRQKNKRLAAARSGTDLKTLPCFTPLFSVMSGSP